MANSFFSNISQIFEDDQTLPLTLKPSQYQVEPGLVPRAWNYEVDLKKKNIGNFTGDAEQIAQALITQPTTSANLVNYIKSNPNLGLVGIRVFPVTQGGRRTSFEGELYVFTKAAGSAATIYDQNLLKDQSGANLAIAGLPVARLAEPDPGAQFKATESLAKIQDPAKAKAATAANAEAAKPKYATIEQLTDKNTPVGKAWFKLQEDTNVINKLLGLLDNKEFILNQPAPNNALAPLTIILNELFRNVKTPTNLTEAIPYSSTGDYSLKSAINHLYKVSMDPQYSSHQAPDKIGKGELLEILQLIFIYCVNITLSGQTSNLWVTQDQLKNGDPGASIVQLYTNSIKGIAATPAKAGGSSKSVGSGSASDGTAIETEDDLVKVFSGYLKEKGKASMTADEIKATDTFKNIAKGIPFRKGDKSSKPLNSLQSMLFNAQGNETLEVGKYGDNTTKAVKQAFADSTI